MLQSLRLQDFRCFATLDCTLGSGTTAFVGENAQGKTSLLEAACMLLRLSSPRTRSKAELVRFGESRFGLAGKFGETELKILGSPRTRKLFHDGSPIEKATDYLAESGLVVWMGNGDLDLVQGTSSARRHYLDFTAAQLTPGYLAHLRRYESALRSRNRLLRDAARAGSSPDARTLEAYTQILVQHGTELIATRARLAETLAPAAATAHHDIGGTDAPETLLPTYEPATTAPLEETFATTLTADLRRGLTTTGPHRDDLALTLDARPAARFGSEGQQRTTALALKLAQARLLHESRGTPPLLLLDDIFGELDPARRRRLLESLPQGSQKLLTTTHLDWAENTPAAPDKIYTVKNGTIAPSPLSE